MALTVATWHPMLIFNWSAQAARQSFYLSNMVPQVGRGMNQGIWKAFIHVPI